MSDARSAFAALAERFTADPDVDTGTGFGSAPGLRVTGKIFAMLPEEELVVKLPRERCEELVSAGEGRLFVIGKRTMREWVAIPTVDRDRWTELASEALAFVRN